MAATEVTIVATAEPVTLQEAKTHLRQTAPGDDARIRGLLTAAREWVENEIRRKLCTQTLKLYLDAFPCWEGGRLPTSPCGWAGVYAIELPFGPVLAVTELQYFDLADVSTVLATTEYQVDLKSLPARIVPVFGRLWPFTYFRLNAVSVTFRVGSTTIPEAARTGILLKLQELYEGAETALAVDSILSPLSPVIQ